MIGHFSLSRLQLFECYIDIRVKDRRSEKIIKLFEQRVLSNKKLPLSSHDIHKLKNSNRERENIRTWTFFCPTRTSIHRLFSMGTTLRLVIPPTKGTNRAPMTRITVISILLQPICSIVGDRTKNSR